MSQFSSHFLSASFGHPYSLPHGVLSPEPDHEGYSRRGSIGNIRFNYGHVVHSLSAQNVANRWNQPCWLDSIC
jgi:hypothetical protein